MTAQIIGAVIGAFIVYLLAAFIGWDFDPAHWGIEARAYAAVLLVVGGMAGVVVGSLK
jgi:hypothetical protein